LLNTRSSFYFGHLVDATNFTIDFSENSGADVYQASLNLGTYSLTDFVTEVERALNAEGGQEYSVSLTRSSRTVTISGASNFELLTQSGLSLGTSAFSLIGFNTGGSDNTGSNSYTGENPSGEEYRPQFFLQNYIDFEDMQEASSSSVSTSAQGIVQVASFGNNKFMECNIENITDLFKSKGHWIENNPNAVSDFREFMLYATQKGEMEFLPDRDDTSSSGFTKCILESTRMSKDGTGFTIYELYGRGLPNFFESKKLKFRKVT